MTNTGKAASRRSYLFTSESVSEGHPDKVADQISDAILDAYLEKDSESRVACECLITTQYLVVAGEVNSKAKNEVNHISVAKSVLEQIGYISMESGFDAGSAGYAILVHEQSPEINRSVRDGGAGDQGLMFGYASNETPSLMPMPIFLSHEIMKRLSELRKSGRIDWLLPDAKTQVTLRYEEDIPTAVEKVVLSTQHRKEVSQDEIRRTVIAEVLNPILNTYLPDNHPEFLINPSGRFTVGGPHGDTGLTGRKIMVDTYGGSCPHGGGAFSGKDPSKVDRSGAYAARYVAKHLVEAGLADRCTLQISYAIGREEPTSLFIDLHGTGRTDENILVASLPEIFDLRPNSIIATLGLKNPIYQPTAAYGHFGKQGLPWEILDDEILTKLKRFIR